MKELIIESDDERLLKEALESGVKVALSKVKVEGMKRIWTDEDADLVLTSSMDEIPRLKGEGKEVAFSVFIKGKEDYEKAVKASIAGASVIVVDASDWKIIPLENLISELKGRSRLYAKASSIEEVEALYGVLEIGVDGVILKAEGIGEVREALKRLGFLKEIGLKVAKIKEVVEAGMGERVCIDTASMLGLGEGLLVGSKSNFLFLVHNESVGSEFTSPRPFRVNAGAVHSYVLMPDGRTKYLSEIRSGDRVLVVGFKGNTRVAVVGRAKIERRPLLLVRAEVDGEEGSILVQNAETIRLVKRGGEPVSVTELKEGDEVLVMRTEPVGRHFGREVEEFILEV